MHDDARQRLKAERDLRWFFGDAEGDLGVRAINYERIMEQRAHEKLARDEWLREEDRLGARTRRNNAAAAAAAMAADRADVCIRYGSIAAAFRALAHDDARVLALAYTARPWPPELDSWNEHAGVAAWLLSRGNVDDAAGELLAMVRDQDRAPDVGALYTRATRRLREALREYCAAADAPRAYARA